MSKTFWLKLFFLLLTSFFSSMLFSQERDTTSVQYSGTIGDKYQISMVLFSYDKIEKGQVFGYYYYEKNKSPIYLTGEKTGKKTILDEELDEGKRNAQFVGVETDAGYSGIWKMRKKELNFKLEIPKNPVGIHKMNNDEIAAGIYNAKNDYITGNLTITKNDKINFSIDIDTNVQFPHTGSAAGGLSKDRFGAWSYGVSVNDEKTKQLEEKCALFFIVFDKKIFLFESGDNSYLDFGAQVYASGVYERN